MSVSEIMPYVLDNIRLTGFSASKPECRMYALLIDTFPIFSVDKELLIGVFILTYSNAPSCEQNQNFAPRPQAQGLAPFGNPPSPSQTSDRFTLRSTRLFRSPRHASGQIRNAPPSSDRWASHQLHHLRLWLLSSHFLPSPSRLQRRRLGRVTASETGTASGAQAFRKNPGLCRRVASQRSWFVHAQTPGADPPEIRLGRPSSQSRTGSVSTQKKTPIVRQRRHCHRWLRPMFWWPTMKPYDAKPWDLNVGEVPVQGGVVWSARVWRLGCKLFRYQRQHIYRLRAPLQWWLLPAFNPK